MRALLNEFNAQVINRVDGRILPAGPRTATLAEVEAALAAADGIVLYAGVLSDAPGQAYLSLLQTLIDGDHRGIRRAAASLFRALATIADGLPGPGDAWQRYLARQILIDENPFSRSAQRHSLAEVPVGLRRAALRDLRALGLLLQLNGSGLAGVVADVLDGEPPWSNLAGLGQEISDERLIAGLVETGPDVSNDLLGDLVEYYQASGVGRFAEFTAFRWARRGGVGALLPVARPDPITFDDLIGYEEQRRVIRRNTEHFLARLPAQNLLLYGERGTGKSSTVKALLNAYAHRGFRLVEVAKSALADFPEVIAALADRRERFVVFVDDLSFDENETGYKELKAVLEGGVEVRPENVLVYATSNRRHLIQERFSDRVEPGDEVHAQDTLQEKLSLADRFGMTVIFSTPDQQQYLDIVIGLAKRRLLAVDADQLRRDALRWAVWNNGRSGRTARQFVDDLTAELQSRETSRCGS